jgi:hypothetical protein
MPPTVQELEKKIQNLTAKLDAAIGTINKLSDAWNSQKPFHNAVQETLKELANSFLLVSVKIGKAEEAIQKLENIPAHLCTVNPVNIYTPETYRETIHQIKTDVSNLSSQLQSLQVETQKCNLIFYGVPEEEESESDNKLLSKIENIFEKGLRLSPKSSSSSISTARLGKAKAHEPNSNNRPRPVKVNFPNMALRQAAWKSRFCLKGSPFAVSEDLPISIRIERAKQRQEPTLTKSNDNHRPTKTTVTVSHQIPQPPSPPNPRPVFSPRRKTLPVTPKVHPFFNSKKKKKKGGT